MRFQAKSGVDILLPACARCRLTGQSQYDMDKCPIKNFDDEGDYCVPELCDEYTEEET